MNPFVLLLCGILLLVLILLSAFFSGSETILFWLSPIQVQRIRNRDAGAGRRKGDAGVLACSARKVIFVYFSAGNACPRGPGDDPIPTRRRLL